MRRSSTHTKRRPRPHRRPRRRRELKRLRARHTRQRRLERRRRSAAIRRRRWANAGWWYRHPLEWLALESGFAQEYANFRRREIGKAFVYTGEVDVGDA